MKKFKIYYTAFKGTKYAQPSAHIPIIRARDIGSAINKFNSIKFQHKVDITKVIEVI